MVYKFFKYLFAADAYIKFNAKVIYLKKERNIHWHKIFIGRYFGYQLATNEMKKKAAWEKTKEQLESCHDNLPHSVLNSLYY